jgi:sulfate adenylyltransferase subunit 2
MNLPDTIFQNRTDESGNLLYWDTASVHDVMLSISPEQSLRATERSLSEFLPGTIPLSDIKDELGGQSKLQVAERLDAQAKKKRFQSLVIQEHESKGHILFANDARSGRRWVYLEDVESENADSALMLALVALAGDKNLIVWPSGGIIKKLRRLVDVNGGHDISIKKGQIIRIGILAFQEPSNIKFNPELSPRKKTRDADQLSHLDRLEAESMHIIREVMSQAENPVMLYSVGKDSSVMLHLAKKAFYPSPPPFPLMHVDTRWKFQEMYKFRDKAVAESGMDLIVHINPEGVAKNINPYDHGSALHTDIMKTEGLKQALDKYEFDVAFGGARRDEEKSRAKERVFSFRTPAHRWDPKNQRPELWNLYNGYKTKGESIRVFPLSNWTELDIWQYIYRENIEIVPLYYSAERPVVERDGMLLMIDDDRTKLLEGEEIQIKRVRFRTLGCYPLTGAVESEADDLPSIVLELLNSRTSERQGRAIDSDSSGSMEKKKQEGYF